MKTRKRRVQSNGPPAEVSTMPQENPISLALKEWQVAVTALLRGELAFLMRKGGIHEPGNRFLSEAARFWLFPTFEHQFEYFDKGIELLKEPWAGRLKASRRVCRSAEEAEATGVGVNTPATIPIEGYVETEAVHPFWTQPAIEALTDFGIWTPEFAETRLRWKPRQPLVFFHLKAHRLAEPLTVEADHVPKRCTSWLELPLAIRDNPGEPVACPSSDALRALCLELTNSRDEELARKEGRVVA